MKRVLILEDNEERIAGFRNAINKLGDDFDLYVWRDAKVMVRECSKYFDEVVLISLDHDLNEMDKDRTDSGTGMDVVTFLVSCRPVCPVLIHSSNTPCAYSMMNELRFAQWTVERVGPIGSDWIETTWLNKVRILLKTSPAFGSIHFPADHEARLNRARVSLEGLSVGDGFGECFFTSDAIITERLRDRIIPPRPWIVTDDTMMALSIMRSLRIHGRIEQEWLARQFSSEYARDPNRGYGGMAQQILRVINEGISWKAVSKSVFNGQGSCGNGGAMRAAPIGAYFADDHLEVIRQAKMSAEITHAHPDGQCGAIAVALAAAWMVTRAHAGIQAGYALIEFVLENIPQTETYHALRKALSVPLTIDPRRAAGLLGNGSRVVSWDTVPFCLWCAAQHRGNYSDTLWTTVAGLGDRDTTCAIVGGIVALSLDEMGIPGAWIDSREAIYIG